MTRRDTLAELHTRLAERLERSRSEPAAASWLAVECAGRGLLLALQGAGEIFVPAPVLPVPHTRPWFLGVANLRGHLHGVVDLASFLGLREPAAEPPVGGRDPGADGARLVTLNPSLGVQCAVRVDRLAGLRTAAQLESADAPPPAMDAVRPAFAGALWRDLAGRTWQEIDLAALSRDEHFLGIAA
jgi:twitching motility protein PilI